MMRLRVALYALLAVMVVGGGIFATTQLTSAPDPHRTLAPPASSTSTVTSGPTAVAAPTVSPLQQVATSTRAAVTPIPIPSAIAALLPPTRTPSPAPVAVTPQPDVTTFVSSTVLIAARGSGPGQLALEPLPGWGCPVVGPAAFDVDTAGNIYIIDRLNYRINKYDSAGRFVFSFGYPHPDLRDKMAPRPEGAINPIDIAVAPDGSVFLASYYGLVKKFDASGKFVADYGQDDNRSQVYFVTVSQVGRVLLFVLPNEPGPVAAFNLYDLGSTTAPATRADANMVRATADPAKETVGLARDGFISGSWSRTPDRTSGRVYVRLPDGRDRQLDLTLSGYTVQAFYFVPGRDMLYAVAAVQKSASDQTEERVFAYDNTQRLSSFRPVEGAMNGCLRRRFWTSPNGTLHQMLIEKELVSVVRWVVRDNR